MMPAPLIDLLNRVDAPGSVMLHCVPTLWRDKIAQRRAAEAFLVIAKSMIRVTDVRGDNMTFRVEQLVMMNDPRHVEPRGTWTTLSTHGGQRPGEGLKSALLQAMKDQKKLLTKLGERSRKLVMP